MNHTHPTDDGNGRAGYARFSPPKKRWFAISIALLIGLYTFLRPTLNERFGWDLPATSNQNVEQASGDGTPTVVRDVPDTDTDNDLLYGLLQQIGPDRYLSPEGLQYTPGSAEGHRLEHLRRHVEDQPGRPGSHGVFDGGMEGALKTIDRAYQRAKQDVRTTKRTDQGRTIYTVDMGGRVGFVGGRDGGRRRNPMARRVRLVLDGTKVITAYPL
jgi:hypothetical protein